MRAGVSSLLLRPHRACNCATALPCLHAPLANPPPQYERLTRPDGMGGELAQLKAFLGIDPALPSSQLPLTNYKHQRGAPDAASLPAVPAFAQCLPGCSYPLLAAAIPSFCLAACCSAQFFMHAVL